MTRFVIELNDDTKAAMLIAMLKRLVTTQDIELVVERNGEGISLDAMNDDGRFDSLVSQIIEDALAGRLEPLTGQEKRENDAYWEKVGAEVGLTDDDIVKLVKDQRAENQSQAIL